MRRSLLKPILAVLHCESTAVNVLEESAAGMVLSFAGVSIAPGDYVYADLNGVLVSGARLL